MIERKVFLSTWKEIPSSHEIQSSVSNVSLTTDQVEAKLNANNIFTIARRSIDTQDLIYMSAKLVNNIWLLAEVKVVSSTATCHVSVMFLFNAHQQ